MTPLSEFSVEPEQQVRSLMWSFFSSSWGGGASDKMSGDIPPFLQLTVTDCKSIMLAQ
jgi:hypothetical protein